MAKSSRTSTRRGSARVSPRRRRAATAEAPPPAPAPIIDVVPVPSEPGEPAGVEREFTETLPEPRFAARTLPPDPERPLPSTRRAIFFDVENTSRASHVARLIDHLAVDRLGQRTDFVAVGNWRVIGHDTARLLARHGAHLVHAAPSVGVKDWSDLRIAVSAGVWLGTARAGDILEIVSDDRAFDAVGDVAANLGIAYRRLSYRSLSGAPEHEPVEDARPEPHERRAQPHPQEPRGRFGRRGRRRGGRGRGPAPVPPPPARTAHSPVRTAASPARIAPSHAPAAPVHREPIAEPAGDGGERHTAPHDEIVSVVRDLITASPARSTTLDALANTLKAHGFSRPPGSPRLITRLRRIKEVAVSRSGTITLNDSAMEEEPAPPSSTAVEEPEVDARVEEAAATEPDVDGNQAVSADQPKRRRRSRRGGRRHRRNRAPAV